MQAEVLLHLVCLHHFIPQSLDGHQSICDVHNSSSTVVQDLSKLLPQKAPVMVAVRVDVMTGSHACCNAVPEVLLYACDTDSDHCGLSSDLQPLHCVFTHQHVGDHIVYFQT